MFFRAAKASILALMWEAAVVSTWASAMVLSAELLRSGFFEHVLEGIATRFSGSLATWVLVPCALLAIAETVYEKKTGRRVFSGSALRLAIRIPAVILFAVLSVSLFFSAWRTSQAMLVLVWAVFSILLFALIAAAHAIVEYAESRIAQPQLTSASHVERE